MARSRRSARSPLSDRRLTYDSVGGTRPAEDVWTATPPGYRRLESTVLVGRGDEIWEAAGDQVLRWAVKTRSGFTVDGPAAAVRQGDRRWVTARVGPLVIREPVQVVAVASSTDRVGFAYGTLDGHPVSGEEAFIVHRDSAGRVWLTLRSLTRPAPNGPWRGIFPLLLVAQRRYRRRYQRSLRDPDATSGPGVFSRHEDLQLAGGPIRLHSLGDDGGAPVLLLHGAMLDSADLVWRQLAPDLAAAGYRVLAIDLPRHGGSRPWVGPVDQARLELILDELLDTIGVDRLPMVGISMGAGTTIGYLLHRADRVTGAVLLAPGGLEARRPAQLLTWLALRTPGLLRLTTWWLATFPGAVRSSIASALAGGTQTPGFDDLVQLAATEARRKQQHHERALDDWQVLAYGPRAMRTNFLPELGQIARPTLWLRGEADPLVSRQDVAAAVAATPGALAAAIPQAGHLAPLDQPDVVARHVVDFLSTLD